MPVHSDPPPSVSTCSRRVDNTSDESASGDRCGRRSASLRRVPTHRPLRLGWLLHPRQRRSGRTPGRSVPHVAGGRPAVRCRAGARPRRSVEGPRRLGRFAVIDAGAGPGTLARSIIVARPACRAALEYVAVELSSEHQRAEHPADVESRPNLPQGPFDGVIVANESLDNLPFRLGVFDGAWREAFVIAHDDGTFGEVLSASFDPRPAVLPPSPAHGSRAPLHDGAVTWLADARARLRAGRLIAIDYFATLDRRVVRRPWREWLRTYRDHGPWQPLPRRSRRSGHHRGDRRRPASPAVGDELAGRVLAALGHRRSGCRRPTCLGGQRRRSRCSGDGDAQPSCGGRRAARSRRVGGFSVIEWSSAP